MNHTFILYSDFTSVECHALNEYLATHPANTRVEWRGVQHDPALPSLQRAMTRRDTERVEDEIGEIRRRAPALDVALPRSKPSSARAILAVASVLRLHSAKAIAFRDGVYRAYWREGADISLPAELQRIADASGVPRFVDLAHPAADDMADEWEVAFATERLGGVPRAIRSDGRILWGLRTADELATFFREP